MNLLTISNLNMRLGGNHVLHDVDFAISRGEIVTIVGPNGSGKTTLLRAILGALRPTGGRVDRAPGLRIGYVPQRLHIDPTLPLTVRRFLSLPVRVGEARAAEALERAGVADLGGRQMTDLSGG